MINYKIYFIFFIYFFYKNKYIKGRLKVSQLINNHYYLERKRMLSINGWNLGLVACSLVMCRSCKGRLAKGGLSVSERAIVQQCLAQEQMCKGSLGDCKWGRIFWITNLEKCKTADLVQESKYRFGLVVRLTANKCYKDTFYFLSFLPTIFRLPSSALYIGLITLHQIICRII